MNEMVVRDNDIDSKKELIKRMYCKNVSDDEFEIFLHTCKRLGLDPRARQIYAVKRGSGMTIQTGVDGFRLVAERTGKYAPGRETDYKYDKDGRLVSATAYVKKLVSGTWHEVPATAFFSEYAVYVGNDLGQFWKTKPHIMLGKCAETIALRKAFPMELSGVYSTEEMENAEAEVDQVKEPKRPFEKTIDEYRAMAEEMWTGMKSINKELCVDMPREMPYFLEYCQSKLPNTDIRNRLKDWTTDGYKFLMGMESWYNREGYKGEGRKMDNEMTA